jgi:hypothetical protein
MQLKNELFFQLWIVLICDRAPSGVYGPYKSITRYVFASPVPVCLDGAMPGAVPNY